LSFPLSEFAGVNVPNLSKIAMTVDGTASDSADLAIDFLRAVGCETPPAPE